MAVTPVWKAATTGFGANAGFINQFLGTHSSSFLYSGAVRSSRTTGTGVFTDTQTQWMSQQFTTASSQTSVAYVYVQVSTVGGSPTSQLINPLTVSLYADSGGLPTGSALVTATLASSTVYSSSFWVTVPLPVSGLTPSTVYHLVIPRVGTSGHYYVWQRSNQVAGAATSTDGSTWTSQTYGFMYQVYDQSTTGSQVQYISDDSGARLISLTYNANGTLNTISEYTVAQGSGNVLLQNRTLAYTNGLVTGVS